jgi:iron(III) transport system permease protein
MCEGAFAYIVSRQIPSNQFFVLTTAPPVFTTLRRSLPALPPAILVAAPLCILLLSWLRMDGAVWAHLWETLLPEMLLNTLLLVVGVAALSLVLGAGLAWIVTAYRFPGARLADWLLALPLAMPGYVLGYVFMSIFDYAGPVQTYLRGWFGPDFELPDIRSLPGAILVLALATYPYVYLLARAAFREQSATQRDAARAAGYGDLSIFMRVALPLARPALAAGVGFVIMETLADFAVVRYFNVITLSEGVVRLWIVNSDRDSAVQLASLLMLAGFATLMLERALRSRARFDQVGNRARPVQPKRLTGIRATLALITTLSVFMLAFGVPAWQLIDWARAELATADPAALEVTFTQHLPNSLALAGAAALIVLLVGLLMVYALRKRSGTNPRIARVIGRAATLGYALPGSVVALGMLLLLSSFNEPASALFGAGFLLSGSLLGLLYGYAVRFIAIGFNGIESGLEKITPNMEMAARMLGAATPRVLGRVHAPLLRGSLLTVVLLVFVDVLKELPLTLFLRPFGMDTLSVWTFMLASESAWQSAALPALIIVVLSAGPALLLLRWTRADGNAS